MCLPISGNGPRLVTVETGIDHTPRLDRWMRGKLDELGQEDLRGFVFKSQSPSCGVADTEIRSSRGSGLTRGPGLFTRAFIRRFPDVPVEDEQRLHDEAVRENFIERIFTFARWREYVVGDGSRGGLVAWHSDHKLLLLSHSPVLARQLGGLVAGAASTGVRETRGRYREVLIRALAIPATKSKHVNVLQHAAGYFKRQLTPERKRELGEAIEAYRHGMVPLVVPVTLINHYVREFGESYLQRQVYLNPNPLEMLMRCHA